MKFYVNLTGSLGAWLFGGTLRLASLEGVSE